MADTRSGAGGVPAQPLAASGGTITFTVTGEGQVPATGVSDVYVVINAISPAADGCLNDYAADVTNPAICTVSFQTGVDAADSDVVAVSDSGQVSVTNESSGTVDVVVSVLGYVQDDTAPAAGDTYVPVQQAQIVDTRSGLGAPQAQVPAGGSLTVQVGGQGGVPADAAGIALFVGAANAAQDGDVSAYPAGGTDPGVAVFDYRPGRKARDLYLGALSSSGQLTLVNHGKGPVDLMIGVEGYLVSPSAREAGSQYQDIEEQRIVDTRNGTGGVSASPLPAGGSITFTVAGADDSDVPASGITTVVESVAAISPVATGFLSVYAAGGTDPGNPGVSFDAGDGQDNDLAAPVSPSGQETITNHSTGTVDVVVSARGYYAAPDVPAAPFSVSASVTGTSATVSWQPPASDGGAAITGYMVTVAPDNASVTVSGTALQVTLTGLANAPADTFTVTASNALGDGDGLPHVPAGVISGTVLSPGGEPVAGAPVTIYSSDVPAGDPSGWNPATVGTATTDANGIWTFTDPQVQPAPVAVSDAATVGGMSPHCKAAQEGGALKVYTSQIWTKDLYTAVGEYHANFDATAMIMYEDGSSTDVGVMVSADAKHFHVENEDSVYDSETGSGGGFTDPDQYNAGKLYVLFKYIKTETRWFIPNGPYDGGPPPAGSTICRKRFWINPDGIVPSGNGVNNLTWTDPTSQASHDMWEKLDGYAGYENDMPKSKHNRVPWQCGGFYYAKSGQGYNYSWAATVGGIGIEAETDHSSDTWQQVNFGCATRKDKLKGGRTDGTHWLWGSNAPAGNPSHPKIFYNY
ncbi:MAG TPA: fibronectin type III domain-containing protein [Streptosporangiaceae bacterium]|nr:fibronectin type III domain-containing protein [Streptosporangiaceae bacterium]